MLASLPVMRRQKAVQFNCAKRMLASSSAKTLLLPKSIVRTAKARTRVETSAQVQYRSGMPVLVTSSEVAEGASRISRRMGESLTGRGRLRSNGERSTGRSLTENRRGLEDLRIAVTC